MRLILIGAIVAGFYVGDARACNTDLLTVLDWKVTDNKQSSLLPYLLEANVKYNGKRPYRMIHAGVMFSDVLGKKLGQVNLKRDQNVIPDGVALADGQVSVEGRIAQINRDDIVYRTCVWAIVYDDGTKETF
ncbi:hypothetical protein ACLBWZ_08890 [Brucellaceae bacterium C25G]